MQSNDSFEGSRFAVLRNETGSGLLDRLCRCLSQIDPAGASFSEWVNEFMPPTCLHDVQ
jgi:hypothetical protein